MAIRVIANSTENEGEVRKMTQTKNQGLIRRTRLIDRLPPLIRSRIVLSDFVSKWPGLPQRKLEITSLAC